MTKKKKILYSILAFVFGLLFGGILSYCTADGIYWNQGSGLISIVYNNGTNTITLQDKNIGATSSNINSSDSYGNYYQRGNNFGFNENNLPGNCESVSPDLSNYGPGNYFNSNGECYEDYSDYNVDLWGGLTGTPEAMQGPCPSGYHIIDNWLNLSGAFESLGLDFSSTSVAQNYLFMSWPGYFNPMNSQIEYVGSNGWYWASTSTLSMRAQRLRVDMVVDTENFVRGGSVRCFKNEAVSPTYSRTKLYGDTIEHTPEITVLYNNGNSSKNVACNGDNIIQINGLATETATNVFTPYINISYTDEDNQNLTESYSKNNLFLVGQFKKTYTGDNYWILTAQGSNSEVSFSGYLPTFEITGGINESTESGNIFNNFAENSIKFTLSNIPSYIQYVILLFILFFILGFIRKFRRK